MISAGEFLKWLEVFNVQFGSNVISIPVPMSQGGTGAVLAPSQYSLVYSTSSALTLLATQINSVLVTDFQGAPLLSTTLPDNLVTSNPTLANGIATKQYVDQTALTGTSVYAATTTNLNITQAGAGVGATITDASGTFAVLTLDGQAVPLNQNFLYKDSVAPQHEGIYKLTTNGDGVSVPWQGTRAVSYDTAAEINNTGLIIIRNGNTLGGSAWYNSTTIAVVDTTPFDYNEFGNITYPVTLNHGGTNAALTASNGGIVYSGASAMAILAGTATARQMLQSGASGAPAWSTATYPATTTINQILYSSANNVVGAISTLINGVLVTDNTGIPQLLANGAVGRVLTANSGAPPSWQTLASTGAITQVDADLGNGTPAGGILTISGGSTGLQTSGSISTVTLTGILNLASGGSNANLTANNGGIVYSTATAMAILAGTATAGQILRSGATGAPSWSTATYPATAGTSTNVLTSDGTNWLSSPVAGLGSPLTTKGDLYTFSTVNARLPVATGDGKILQVSSGAATGLAYSTPTYPSASGTSGKVLISDGTNNVYSTSTFPTSAGATAGKALVSDGTNFVLGAFAFPTTVGAAGTLLRSDGTNYAATTTTYPNTNAINTLLYASAANVMSALATANSSGLLTNASGVPAWVTATGTGAPVLGTNPTITLPTIPTGINDANGNLLLSFSPVANAVNFFGFINNSTGNQPALIATGSDTDVGFQFNTKGAGAFNFFGNTATFLNQSSKNMFNMTTVSPATAVNYLQSVNAATGVGPGLSAAGTDSNIYLHLTSKGNAGVVLESNGAAVLNAANPASPVNYFTMVGSATGSAIGLLATGTDTNVPVLFTAKGISGVTIANASGSANILALNAVASAVNFVNILANATGSNPAIYASGSDTNITLQIQGQGTGGVYLVGVSTNTNAASGQVGELLSAANVAGSPITFTTGIAKTLQTVTLTPGDWDVWANIFCSGTTVTSGQCSIHTTTNVMADNSLISYQAATGTSAAGMNAPQRRFSVAANTPVYVVGIFTGTGTLSASGGIYARRRR